MKKIFNAVVVLTLVLVPAPVLAVDGSNAAQDIIGRVRENCVSAKITLDRLKVSDTLLRVNIGDEYKIILEKLMNRLNGRAVAEGVDVSTLVRIAAEYKVVQTNFSNGYKDYASSLKSALDIDCIGQPDKFYQAVVSARDKRRALHDFTISMNQLVDAYGAGVTVLAGGEDAE